MLITSAALFAQTKAGKQDTTARISLFTCSMHPDIVTDKAGKCPICGMDLDLSGKQLLKTQVTKTYTCPVHANVTSHVPGKCPECGKALNLSLKEKMKAEAVGIYSCPMDPGVTSSKPGVCPKCGMKLTKKS